MGFLVPSEVACIVESRRTLRAGVGPVTGMDLPMAGQMARLPEWSIALAAPIGHLARVNAYVVLKVASMKK